MKEGKIWDLTDGWFIVKVSRENQSVTFKFPAEEWSWTLHLPEVASLTAFLAAFVAECQRSEEND